MICADIMQKDAPTLTPDTAVSAALVLLQEHKLNAAAVTDAQGFVMGVFSLRHLIENSLPVSMVSESGLGGVVVSAAPGLDLRLQKILQQNVAAVMDRRFFSVHPDTQTERAAQLIAEKGGLVIVLDEDTGHLQGVINEFIMIEGLLSNAAARMKKVTTC